MNITFDFIDREKEIAFIKENFIEAAVKNKKCCTILVKGSRGIGKTSIIERAIDQIFEDPAICTRLHHFKKSIHFIRYTISGLALEPYKPFDSIKKKIEERETVIRFIFYQ